MRKWLLVPALALLTLPAFAQDKVVHVYNWSDYIADDTIRDFEAETGIRVVYDVYDSNEVLEAKLLAGRSGYDVVVPTSSFLQRQVAAGIYLPLDRAKIPNWKELDPAQMKRAAAYDADNTHGVIYMWGTNGIGFNVDKVVERLGEDAPTDSLALVFDPANAAKLADCGITMVDSPHEILPMVLNYLGLPPDSTETAHLEAAEALLMQVRPYVRYFHSSQYINDLANGEICVAIGWSGDVFIAMDRAAEADRGIEIEYTIPEEGTIQWFDMLAIPRDAPNPDAAHAFINFILGPENIAAVTNEVFYPNAVPASLEFVDEEIREDASIYPPQEVVDRLFPSPVYDPGTERTLTRLWTRVRTGR